MSVQGINECSYEAVEAVIKGGLREGKSDAQIKQILVDTFALAEAQAGEWLARQRPPQQEAARFGAEPPDIIRCTRQDIEDTAYLFGKKNPRKR